MNIKPWTPEQDAIVRAHPRDSEALAALIAAGYPERSLNGVAHRRKAHRRAEAEAARFDLDELDLEAAGLDLRKTDTRVRGAQDARGHWWPAMRWTRTAKPAAHRGCYA